MMRVFLPRILQFVSQLLMKGALPVFVLITASVCAQEKSPCRAGVYITEEDFIHNRLSHEINTGEEGYKLNFGFPADMSLTLRIITPDTVFKFTPGSLYGFKECEAVYRFFPGGRELNAQEDFYKIEEATEGFIIYSSLFVSGREIFYSRSLTGPIHRLTLRNLKRDFGDYPEFIAKSKQLKKQPDGLPSRDKNKFRIMELYEGEVE